MAWRVRDAAWVLTAVTLSVFAGACGDDDDDDDDGGNGGNGGGTQVDPDPLNLDIQAATFPASGPPTVTFRVTDQTGTPIDLPTEIGRANQATPKPLPNTSPRFTFAMLDQFGDYRSYYEVSREVDPLWTVPPDLPLPTAPRPPNAAPGTTTQASSTPSPGATTPLDLNTLEALGNGVYRLTLPAVTPGVTGLDRARTHTIAGWVVRTKEGGDQDIAFDSFNFLPDGGAGAVELDQVISDEGCNKCHGVVQAHGTRRGTQICLTCHSPQTSDPETGRIVDFKVMIHKIHAGGTLPSVQTGRTGGALPYYIVGNQRSVHDWSEVAFPWHDGVSHCTACHVGEDANNWRTKPTLATCTSCHDNVLFQGTAASCSTLAEEAWFEDCLHSGGAIPVANPNDPAACQGCHGEGASFAVSNFHHGDAPP